jgi:hypothetical protein
LIACQDRCPLIGSSLLGGVALGATALHLPDGAPDLGVLSPGPACGTTVSSTSRRPSVLTLVHQARGRERRRSGSFEGAGAPLNGLTPLLRLGDVLLFAARSLFQLAGDRLPVLEQGVKDGLTGFVTLVALGSVFRWLG